MMTCPFCSDTDFDAVGLKMHLQAGHCEEFNDVNTLTREDHRCSMKETGKETLRRQCRLDKGHEGEHKFGRRH